MRSTFSKNVGLVVGHFFENYLFRKRGPRGRSRRENSGKILAAAFSRRDVLMVFGVGGSVFGLVLGQFVSVIRTQNPL